MISMKTLYFTIGHCVGHCSGTVRALYGHCTGTVEARNSCDFAILIKLKLSDCMKAVIWCSRHVIFGKTSHASKGPRTESSTTGACGWRT